MADTIYLALDLGAESGRAMAGRWNGATLSLEEIHRFPNRAVELPDGWHWNTLGLYESVRDGIRKAVATHGKAVRSLGLDTWGVDYGLLDAEGGLVGLPYQYRDARTRGLLDEVLATVPRAEIYAATGIQFMEINTLYQILATTRQAPDVLTVADRLLHTPDLFNFWLTGEKVSEYTIASTSQCLDATTRDWATGLLGRLGIPSRLFGPLVAPGSAIGPLRDAVAREVGADLEVIAPGGHDTACAVAAVPATAENWAYLSSGTWSLIGVERPAPILTPEAMAANFTNEGGVCGTIRFLKNIMGLWLVQECRRDWAEAGQAMDYDEITRIAEEAPPFTAVLDAEDAAFLAPGDMPERIRTWCREHGQTAPETPGQIVRTALESLALKYRQAVEGMEAITGRPVDVLHIVGGGTRNRLLNQFTADALNRPVVTGPVEATAAGNVLMQMVADGELEGLADIRRVVAASFETETWEPQAPEAWAEPYRRLVGAE